jgi:glucose/arabinose dehydrogenase
VRAVATAASVVVLLLAGCGTGDPPPDDPAQEPSPTPDAAPDDPAEEAGEGTAGRPDDEPEDDERPREDEAGESPAVEVGTRDVVTDLQAPWDLVVAGDGRILVTERDTGRLLEVGDDGTTSESRTFEVDASGEGGLLGIALHPEDDTVLYAYFTGADDNRVVRFGVDDDPEPEPILTGIPKGRVHNGGRIAFGPDGLLYVATGDAAVPELAADASSLAGKILRVTPDGDLPADNPDPGSPVYSSGHRNVQGLAWDADGQLWATEFGPDVDDEINRIEPGGHHGWPEVTGASGDERFVDAAFVAQPPEASWSGATILHDGAIPQWEGHLFAAALRGERLWRFELEDGVVVEDEELLVGELGRLRTVVVGPDGSLWLLTSNRDGRGSPRQGDDRVVRLGPD